MRNLCFPFEQQAPPSALPQNRITSSPHPYGGVQTVLILPLRWAALRSRLPNKIGGFVVQGILRFTYLISCCKPVTGLPYKDNRKFAQIRKVRGGEFTCLLSFSYGFSLFLGQRYRRRFLDRVSARSGFCEAYRKTGHSVKYD